MQPETATLPAAMQSTSEGNPSDRPSVLRRLQYWLLLSVFWTMLPFVLVPLLDMAWGHPVKLPRLPIHLMLQWWVWIPLTPLISALYRRFPIREPRALKHALIHLLASWLVAVVLNLFLATIAFLLPIEWSPALILNRAFHIFEGFGAVFQILYWSVLAGCSFHQRSRTHHAT